MDLMQNSTELGNAPTGGERRKEDLLGPRHRGSNRPEVEIYFSIGVLKGHSDFSSKINVKPSL